ncbi:MAG: hypothetical protein CPDRYMAC_1821 [uncultured Paraburkholderia sp.]|nr:MAG: hypothetical protein CPDRYDRY_1718 [uncultured Paraburkholderia sp.]CAH2920874.1 MAG: hypothetical protein CPDRYMAC_1821 [uncultured Paraburkholderia sp.]
MNKVYQTVWYDTSSTWVARPETAKSKSGRLVVARTLCAGVVLVGGMSAVMAEPIEAGDGAVAAGAKAIAIGVDSKASGASAIAIGETSKATGDRSIANGFQASTTGEDSVAIGSASVAGPVGGPIASTGVASAFGAYAHATGNGGPRHLATARTQAASARSRRHIRVGGWRQRHGSRLFRNRQRARFHRARSRRYGNRDQ